MSTSPTSPPRGWYPDPGGHEAWRWWDGERWTNELQSFGDIDPELPELLASAEEARRRLLGLGLVLMLLAAVGSALLSSVSLEQVATQLHWARRAWGAALHQQSLPAQPLINQPSWQVVLRWAVVIPSEIFALVTFLRYQFRAAKVARRLGLGDRPSPGLGTGGWFIPLANLWLPLQAWLHLVAPRSRLRTRIWLLWVIVTLAVFCSLGSSLLSMSTMAGARVLLGVGLAAELVGIGLLRSLLLALGEVHHAAGSKALRGEQRVPDTL